MTEDIYDLMVGEDNKKTKAAVQQSQPAPTQFSAQVSPQDYPQSPQQSLPSSDGLRLSREVLLWRLQETLAVSEDKKLADLLTDAVIYIQSAYIPNQSTPPQGNGKVNRWSLRKT